MDITFNNYTDCMRIYDELEKERIQIEHVSLYNEMNSFINDNIVELNYDSELYTEKASSKENSNKGKTFIQKIQEFIENVIEKIKEMLKSLFSEQQTKLDKNFSDKCSAFMSELKQMNESQLKDIKKEFNNQFDAFKQNLSIDDKFKNLKSDIEKMFDKNESNINNKFALLNSDLIDNQNNLIKKISYNENYLNYLYNAINEIISSITKAFNGSYFYKGNIPDSKHLTNLDEKLSNCLGKINEKFIKMKDLLSSIEKCQNNNASELKETIKKYDKNQEDLLDCIKNKFLLEIDNNLFLIKNSSSVNGSFLKTISDQVFQLKDNIEKIKQKKSIKEFKREISESITEKLPITSPLFVSIRDFMKNFADAKKETFNIVTNEKINEKFKKFFITFINKCTNSNYYRKK